MPVHGWFDIAPFEIVQANGPLVHIDPAPGSFQGRFGGFARYNSTSGVVDGEVQDDHVVFTVRWGDGKTGAYDGWLYPDGRVRGTTSEVGGVTVTSEMSLFGLTLWSDVRRPETDVGWWSADGHLWHR